jgi:hypothetical protein
MADMRAHLIMSILCSGTMEKLDEESEELHHKFLEKDVVVSAT